MAGFDELTSLTITDRGPLTAASSSAVGGRRSTVVPEVWEIDVQVDEAFADHVDVERLRRRVSHALEAAGWSGPAVVSVTVTDDDSIRVLNREYLGIDSPTDVLSFSQLEGLEMPVTEGAPHLGDVIVSYPQTVVQAVEHGEPVHRELERLVVHGVLHLLGYDDVTESERERMWKVQEEVMEIGD